MPHLLKYDWVAISEYYDSGHSYRACRDKYGFSSCAWGKAVKAGRVTPRSLSDSVSLGYKRGTSVQNWSQESRDRRSAHAIATQLGGKRNSHNSIVNGIRHESSYEVRVAAVLDRDGIVWEKPKKRIPWIDDGFKIRYYLPDFYLPVEDVYLDPKNEYLIKIDANKIKKASSQNGISIIVVSIEMIKQWESDKVIVTR